MKLSLRRTIAAALGLATIGLFWIAEPLVNFGNINVYHWSGTAQNLFVPAIGDTLIGWALLTVVLVLAEVSGRGRGVMWAAILAFTPSVLLKSLELMQLFSLSHAVRLTMTGFAAACFVVLLLRWLPPEGDRTDREIAMVSNVFAVIGLCGAALLLQLTWCCWRARDFNRPRPPAAMREAPGAGTRGRIIWIIFDELSQEQTFESRLPGMRLPAFDALAAQSTMFTHAIPADFPLDNDVRTEKIVPALLTGRKVDAIRSSITGQLSMRDSDTGTWREFDANDTVFRDALASGYNTAVAGWYNPYCRILSAVLNSCYWTSGFALPSGIVPDASTGTNMEIPTNSMFGFAKLRHVIQPSWRSEDAARKDAERHIADYEKIVAAADVAIRNRALHFVYLHLPVPHPPGVYDWRSGRLTSGPSTYVDNLALADSYLAHVRELLTEMGQWDSSIIVVMGDHGWRTMVWRPLPGWTAQEERATHGGKFENRPVYLVKLSAQQTSATISRPFSAIHTREMFDGLLGRKIETIVSLSEWVEHTSY